MKLQNLLPASIGLLVVLGAVPSAFAGSAGVTNSWSTRDIKNGYSDLKVNVDDTYAYKREAYATAWKKEAGITIITDNLNENNGKYSSKGGGDDSTQFLEVDKFQAGSDSGAYEWGSGKTVTNVKVSEGYKFSGFDKTHSVSSDFSY